MADYKHVNTADYEERLYKLKRLLEYRNLLQSLGIKKEEIDDRKIPDRDFTFLERMAQQKPYIPFSQTDNGNFPGKGVAYSNELPRITGTYSKRFNDVHFPEIGKMRDQYVEMYKNQPELYHHPEKYYKNLDMTKVRFAPDDIYTGGSYNFMEDDLRLNSYGPHPFDTLVHENEHRNAAKYPKDAMQSEVPWGVFDDLSAARDQQKRFTESFLKLLSNFPRANMGFSGGGWTGQKDGSEMTAELRRLQSLQPYNTLPTSPLEQGGMYMQPIRRK